ncbi:unnamed protein product [Parascedosporium putredinis]|uniref:Cytochrome P450 n=1 Tax=Parascedosporium putredinis TaxID=1442378 RepID=A0A9P1MED7_9PEZI|nr:unnamed protein product [Parascedosporium putredinis]CAI8002438.1 unnamed protein product [Parascedosporium putredinis]
MFTTLNKSDHAKRKRILADRYANSNVMRPVSTSGIQDRARLFTKLCEESVGRSLDIFVASDDSLQNRLIQFYSPRAHKLISKALYFLAKPRETPLADEFVLNASRQPDPEHFTLLKRMLEKSELDQLDMAAECLDHMAAGIDTTGDGLCFLMWEISQPRSFSIQEKLHRELRENPLKSLDKLPYLEAVIWEGLRCFPAIPILNEDVFPAPETFDPERWLDPEGDADRKRLQFAFAAGGRGALENNQLISSRPAASGANSDLSDFKQQRNHQ